MKDSRRDEQQLAAEDQRGWEAEGRSIGHESVLLTNVF